MLGIQGLKYDEPKQMWYNDWVMLISMINKRIYKIKQKRGVKECGFIGQYLFLLWHITQEYQWVKVM